MNRMRIKFEVNMIYFMKNEWNFPLEVNGILDGIDLLEEINRMENGKMS